MTETIVDYVCSMNKNPRLSLEGMKPSSDRSPRISDLAITLFGIWVIGVRDWDCVHAYKVNPRQKILLFIFYFYITKKILIMS